MCETARPAAVSHRSASHLEFGHDYRMVEGAAVRLGMPREIRSYFRYHIRYRII